MRSRMIFVAAALAVGLSSASVAHEQRAIVGGKQRQPTRNEIEALLKEHARSETETTTRGGDDRSRKAQEDDRKGKISGKEDQEGEHDRDAVDGSSARENH